MEMWYVTYKTTLFKMSNYRIDVITTPGFNFSKWIFEWGSIQILLKFYRFLTIVLLTGVLLKFGVSGVLIESGVQILLMRYVRNSIKN